MIYALNCANIFTNCARSLLKLRGTKFWRPRTCEQLPVAYFDPIKVEMNCAQLCKNNYKWCASSPWDNEPLPPSFIAYFHPMITRMNWARFVRWFWWIVRTSLRWYTLIIFEAWVLNCAPISYELCLSPSAFFERRRTPHWFKLNFAAIFTNGACSFFEMYSRRLIIDTGSRIAYIKPKIIEIERIELQLSPIYTTSAYQSPICKTLSLYFATQIFYYKWSLLSAFLWLDV